MPSARKILAKILAGSKNIRFADFIKVVEAVGFELKRIRGSHHIYKHPDVAALLSLQPDSNNQAKRYQIKQLLTLVEEHNLQLED
ncbi:MAG: type II toxin-antitoxin system HicA family toxin [Anaerolineae bacterium]